MKKIFFLALILYCYNANAQNCDNLIGYWHNQLKSNLFINSINPTSGLVVGKYTIKTSTGAETYDLTGFVRKVPGTDGIKTEITFCVNYTKYNSMAAWTGYCTVKNNIPTLHTIWHLVSPNADAVYKHITTDVDDFTPGPAH